MLLIKIVLIMTFIAIAYQDITQRQVYWFLFPVVAIACGLLHYTVVLPEQFTTSLLMNFGFIGLLTIIIYSYARIKMKTQFKHVIGLGDILLFLALTVSFSTISFVLIFIFSLIFSLLIHLVFKRKSKALTVPLAGYMSLFFMITYVAYWLGFTNGLYTL